MKLNCPTCHSSNTQNIKIAYSHAQRENERGYKTISKFGENLNPPQPADPIHYGGVAAILWGATWFFGLWYVESIEYVFQLKTLLWLVLTSAFVFLLGIVRALTYNFRTYYGQEREWSKQYVCRRCGEIFLPDE